MLGEFYNVTNASSTFVIPIWDTRQEDRALSQAIAVFLDQADREPRVEESADSKPSV